MSRDHGVFRGGWVLAFALLHAGGTMALAEDPRPPSSQDPYGAVSRIVPGRTVQLQMPRSGTVSGRFLGNTADSLFLDAGGETRSVPLADIGRLRVRGRSMKQGLLIGGLAGCGTMAMLAAGQQFEGGGGGSGILFAGAMGGILGGFVGSMVGLAVPRWSEEYAAGGKEIGAWTAAQEPAVETAPPAADDIRQHGPPRTRVELLGGYELLGKAQAMVGGRFLFMGNPQFHWGVDYSRVAYGNSESRAGPSFVFGPVFRIKNLRPYVLLGAGVYSNTYEIRLAGGGREKTTDHNFVAQVGPGIRFGMNRFALLTEVKYQVMAVGEFDDVLILSGGVSVSF